MSKWIIALFALMVLTIVPTSAFAASSGGSVNGWNDAGPLLLISLSVISVAALLFFIYSMIRDNG